jgi:6-phosphogluconate dehydrogenase (decarboxylating)
MDRIKVLICGLGAMGGAIYSHLITLPNLSVLGYDIYQPCMDKLMSSDDMQEKINTLRDVNEQFKG